jgi:predicted transposase/invertase (TIGR01784 family)
VSRFVDPTYDTMFKKIFGTPGREFVTQDFIQSVIWPNGEVELETLEFRNTDLQRTVEGQIRGIVDVLCVDKTGNQYIIEIQRAKPAWAGKRAEFYASRVFSNQILNLQELDNSIPDIIAASRDKSPFKNLKKVYLIAILNFSYLEGTDYVNSFIMKNKKTNEVFPEASIEIIYIEIPKFAKTLSAAQQATLDQWLYFLKNYTLEEDVKILSNQSKAIDTARFCINQATWNEKEFREWEAQLKATWDGLAIIEGAIEQGIEKGIEKGRQEGQEKVISMVKQMLAEGDSLDKISRISGLSMEQVKKLSNI